MSYDAMKAFAECRKMHKHTNIESFHLALKILGERFSEVPLSEVLAHLENYNKLDLGASSRETGSPAALILL